MKTEKTAHENKLSTMSLQYGKDLKMLEKDYQKSSALLRDQERRDIQEEMETMKKEHA